MPEFRLRKSKKDSCIDREEERPAFPSAEEEEICKKFGISPEEFLIVKHNLVRESLKQGVVEIDTVSRNFRIKRTAVERIMDFLVQKEELLGSVREGKGGLE